MSEADVMDSLAELSRQIRQLYEQLGTLTDRVDTIEAALREIGGLL